MFYFSFFSALLQDAIFFSILLSTGWRSRSELFFFPFGNLGPSSTRTRSDDRLMMIKQHSSGWDFCRVFLRFLHYVLGWCGSAFFWETTRTRRAKAFLDLRPSGKGGEGGKTKGFYDPARNFFLLLLLLFLLLLLLLLPLLLLLHLLSAVQFLLPFS